LLPKGRKNFFQSLRLVRATFGSSEEKKVKKVQQSHSIASHRQNGGGECCTFVVSKERDASQGSRKSSPTPEEIIPFTERKASFMVERPIGTTDARHLKIED